MSEGEIKIVNAIYKDGGDYMVKCPHCYGWMILEGDDADEIRDEQYHHAAIFHGCDGWLEVSDTARYAGRVPIE